MTRPIDDVLRVAALLDEGMSQAEAARRLGLPQRTVNKWARAGIAAVIAQRQQHSGASAASEPCPRITAVDERAYAYLLGLYLGDGYISSYRRGVYRLQISMCAAYPVMMEECARSMVAVLPNKVGRVLRKGCVDIISYSKHWPCVFPQHGPGRKHRRPIVLEPWQHEIAMKTHPQRLLRGLIHSDGWRGQNRVPRGYEYPRYSFSNRSSDIREIFLAACKELGVSCRQNNQWSLAISRRSDVAYLDTFIGPKQ